MQTTLQAVAVKLFYPIQYIICNIYLPGSESITTSKIEDLINQFDCHFMLIGDFNGHNYIWGSDHIDARGRMIESVLDKFDLNLLNNGEPTHFSFAYKSHSAIDLTIISPILENHFDWFVEEDLHSSDHFPIIIPITSTNRDSSIRKKILIEKADWDMYVQHINLKPEIPYFNNINEHTNFITSQIIAAAEISMPMSSLINNHKKVPWWNNEIRDLIQIRKKYFRKYKSTMNIEDYKNFITARLKTRQLIKKSKKTSWENYIKSISINTKPSEVFRKIRSLNGQSKSNDIPTLINNNHIITSKEEICENLAESFKKSSSSDNYNVSFLAYKRQIERIDPEIISDDNASYNQQISFQELENALKDCRGSSAGPDLIHYEMIKNIPNNQKNTFLTSIIVFFSQIHFQTNGEKRFLFPSLNQIKTPNVPIVIDLFLSQIAFAKSWKEF